MPYSSGANKRFLRIWPAHPGGKPAAVPPKYSSDDAHRHPYAKLLLQQSAKLPSAVDTCLFTLAVFCNGYPCLSQRNSSLQSLQGAQWIVLGSTNTRLKRMRLLDAKPDIGGLTPSLERPLHGSGYADSPLGHATDIQCQRRPSCLRFR